MGAGNKWAKNMYGAEMGNQEVTDILMETRDAQNQPVPAFEIMKPENGMWTVILKTPLCGSLLAKDELVKGGGPGWSL